MDAQQDELLIDVYGLFDTFELRMKEQIDEIEALAISKDHAKKVFGADTQCHTI